MARLTELGAALADGLARHSLTAFLVVLALMGGARVAELLVARQLTWQAAVRGERPQREPIFVVMVALHTLPFVLAPLEVIALDRPLLPALFVACVALLVLLAATRVWTLRTLGARWNVRIVRPDAVVVDGPYRFIRHPNYAVVIAELFVLPLVHTAWVTCLVLSALNAFVLWRRIPAEERVLLDVPGYREHMAHKKRFVPGLF